MPVAVLARAWKYDTGAHGVCGGHTQSNPQHTQHAAKSNIIIWVRILKQQYSKQQRNRVVVHTDGSDTQLRRDTVA